MANSLQAQGELIDHALVVDGSLIVHAPGTASELQATLVDQLADDRLGSFGLLRPPFGEEGGLHLDEAARGVLDQLSDHSVDDVLDTSVLDVALVAIEVLVNGLQPADVVVGVGNHVDVDHVRLGLGACLESRGGFF